MFGRTSEWLERPAAPHHLVSEPNTSRPPPPSVADVSEALLVAIQGRPSGKCDMRHASSHAGEKSVKPMADRPLGMDKECTGQQCGGISDDNATLRLLGDARRYDGPARFTASTCW